MVGFKNHKIRKEIVLILKIQRMLLRQLDLKRLVLVRLELLNVNYGGKNIRLNLKCLNQNHSNLSM